MTAPKILMGGSALFLALVGVGGTFLPSEILTLSGLPEPHGIAPAVIQLLGALSLGFAILNWMARTAPVGGIYGRPIAMGNAIHFSTGATALVKGIVAGDATAPLLIVTACYALFAASFLLLLFTHPGQP